jgi:hypothetical protein
MKRVKLVLEKLGWETRTIHEFDPLSDRSDKPTVMQIHSSSGCCSHAVTIVGDLIFDSNKTRAVNLDVSGLDRVCLGIDTFHEAKSAFRLVPCMKVKNRMGFLKRRYCVKLPSKKHKTFQ